MTHGTRKGLSLAAPLSPLLSTPWITQGCRLLHENKTWKVLGVEVLGINLPKTAIVRTRDEAIDVGVNEFGNTAGFFGGVWGGSYLVDKLLTRMKVPVYSDPAILSQGRVMKSFALVPPLLALMVAMPFFRNAFTTWRTGTTDYRNLITGSGTTGPTPAQRREAQDWVNQNVKKGLTILASGLAVGVGGFLLAASRGNLRLFRPNSSRLIPALNKPWVAKTLKNLCLTGAKATEYEDLRAMFYWGIPAYLGWMAASRDGFEIKEQLLKMVNFVAVYVLTEKGVNKFFERKTRELAGKVPQLYTRTGNKIRFSYGALAGKLNNPGVMEALKFENLKILTGFGLTVLLMAVLPALLNIYLTKRRIENSQPLPSEYTFKAQPKSDFRAPFNAPLENRSHSGYAYIYRVHSIA